jgi:hypothetical protein
VVKDEWRHISTRLIGDMSMRTEEKDVLERYKGKSVKRTLRRVKVKKIVK